MIKMPKVSHPSPAVRTAFSRGALIAALLAATALPVSAAEPTPATMQLDGQASVSVKPDMALISTGVVTQDKTARAALSANTKAMSALMDMLSKAGIAERDLQTSNFSVQPIYVYPKPTTSETTPPPPRIVGYEVSNTLSVKVRKLEMLGTILDEMVSAGSNNVHGLSFTIADNTDALAAARKAAIQDALDKARLYADAAGVCLVRITDIAELSSRQPSPIRLEAKAMVADSAPVPIQGGELDLSAQVRVSWEIGPQPCAQP